MRSILVFATVSLAIHSAFAQTSGPPDKPLSVLWSSARGRRGSGRRPNTSRKLGPPTQQRKKRYLAGPTTGFTRSQLACGFIRPIRNLGEKRHEIVLVVVDAIKDGSITGRISSNLLLLTNYRQGERISDSRVSS